MGILIAISTHFWPSHELQVETIEAGNAIYAGTLIDMDTNCCLWWDLWNVRSKLWIFNPFFLENAHATLVFFIVPPLTFGNVYATIHKYLRCNGEFLKELHCLYSISHVLTLSNLTLSLFFARYLLECRRMATKCIRVCDELQWTSRKRCYLRWQLALHGYGSLGWREWWSFVSALLCNCVSCCSTWNDIHWLK